MYVPMSLPRSLLALSLFASSLVPLGCSGTLDPPGRTQEDAAVPDLAAAPDLAAVPDAPAVRRCRPPTGVPGVSGSPRSISEVVALVNALPPPVTLSCYLESLDRPLQAFATSSVISLQPAAGARNPRIFLISGKLVTSLVPVGMGSHTLEFGQFVDEARSIKAEIGFPVEPPLAPAAPYQRIMNTNGKPGTSCRFCHPNEELAAEIDYAEAYISGAFRPNWRTRVDLPAIRDERAHCDEVAEPGRCAILGALLDHGEVVQQELPETVPTIN
jgi:hypothetical protein